MVRGQGPARLGDLLKVIQAEREPFLFFLTSLSFRVTIGAGAGTHVRPSIPECWLLPQAVLLFLPSKGMDFYPFIQLQNKLGKKKNVGVTGATDRILKLGS